MRARDIFAIATIGLLGIVAAAGMGLLANEISGDSIGLSAKPLRAGNQLAPAQASQRQGSRDRADSRSDDGHGGGRNRGPETTTSTTETTTTVPATTTTELGDDHGGETEIGEDSGSDSSGSGSDDSGFDDSSGSGSGSDDSGFDD